MLKLIKGIFDVRAKREHRGRASWPKLLLAFSVVQAQNRSGRPGHGFPGVREYLSKIYQKLMQLM